MSSDLCIFKSTRMPRPVGRQSSGSGIKRTSEGELRYMCSCGKNAYLHQTGGNMGAERQSRAWSSPTPVSFLPRVFVFSAAFLTSSQPPTLTNHYTHINTIPCCQQMIDSWRRTVTHNLTEPSNVAATGFLFLSEDLDSILHLR